MPLQPDTPPHDGALIPFAFEGHPVRAISRDGAPWFVAADVCAALDIKNASQSVAALDADERAMFNIGRRGDVNVISESGLYTLALRCRDATTPGTLPHRFRRWVTTEVLPAIRKTGSYTAPGASAPQPTIPTTAEKLAIVREARLTFGCPTAQRVWRELRVTEMPQPERPAQGDMFTGAEQHAVLSRMVPRHVVLTPDVLRRIEARLDEGLGIEAACRAEGIKPDTLRRARGRARQRAQQQH